MSRLPIRQRLTLAFVLAMAVVLAATGALLYLGLRSSLDETIRDGLDARVEDISAGISPGPDTDERLTEVRRAGERGRSALTDGELERARAGETVVVERERVAGLEGRVRILARAVATPDGQRVVVVGASLEDREEALDGLLAQLLLFGPLALVLASLLGYAVARAALRPVEEMRAEAAVISGAEPGRRLPVPRARDEISKLGETLNEMLGRLEGALARERAFVADASHELRTPLARLQGELELALRRPRPPEELEAAIRSASTETERLARLAEDLLVLARSDRARLGLRREPVDAANRARDIERALSNLIANAVEHGAEPIELSVEERDGRVELHVRDAGPGFPAEFLPRAFERFSRADEARTGGGTGLGLAIVAAIAHAHGGEAHAANRPDGGADVWLSLPR